MKSSAPFRALFSVVALSLVPHLAWAAKSHADNSAMADLTVKYLELTDHLTHDALPEAKAAARQILTASAALTEPVRKEVSEAATQLGESKNLTQARESLRALSRPLANWVKKTKPANLEVAYCPMAGAKWVQRKGELRNPYFGNEMQSCGEKLN